MKNRDKNNSGRSENREKNDKKQSNNEATTIRLKTTLSHLAILFLSGMLLATAFPEMNWSGAAWVAVIPLFLAVQRQTIRRAALYGFVWGLGWAICSFFWLREIFFVAPFLLAPYMALYPMVWAMLIPPIRRYLLIPVDIQLKGYEQESKFEKTSALKEILFLLTIATLWVILEWIRTWLFTGLPWNLLGVSQWKNLPIIQIAEYTGVYGVSFVVIMINISAAMTFDAWKRVFKKGRYKRPFPLMVALGCLMVASVFGTKTILHFKKKKRVNPMEERHKKEVFIGVLQGDIPQCRNPKPGQAEFAAKTYLELSKQIAYLRPDVIIWPETAIPFPFRGNTPFIYNFRKEFLNIVTRSKIPFLIGTIDFERLPNQKELAIYNTAMLFDKNGKITGRYNKQHAVPFGEYVPFSNYFPFLIKWIGMGRGLTEGRSSMPLELAPGIRAGINICYEDIFPNISTAAAKNGANLLVTITNDAWYPTSDEPTQHLANSIFRAIETRLPVIRCGNNGASVYITKTGRIAEALLHREVLTKNRKVISLPAPEKRGKASGVFKFKITKNPKQTFYTRHGNIFILICWIIFANGIGIALFNWKQKKASLSLSNQPLE